MMDDTIEIVVYDITKTTWQTLNEPCILTFYPFPKEMLDIMYNKHLSKEIVEFNILNSHNSRCELMKIFAANNFPEADIILMPLELSTALYRIGEYWIEKTILQDEARQLHRAASLFADFIHLTIHLDNNDFVYEGRRNRNIVKIPATVIN